MKRVVKNISTYSTGKLKIAETGMGGTSYYELRQEFDHLLRFHAPSTPLHHHPLDNRWNRYIKRAVDVLVSLVVIVGLLSWLTPLIALLIKIDSPGPVFFLQKRNKRNGQLFTCLKFRSMITNMDADILPAVKNDKRITPVGHFLRDHYLDELPQFINVLLGDMSIIGPRPHMISDNIRYDELIHDYGYRHKVKPGITGLAQVMGYTGVAENIGMMKERVNMDIFYVRHWTMKMDIAVFVHTVARAIGL